MAATVNDILTGAGRLCNMIDESQAALSAGDGIEALWVLNNMLANFAADGLDLGWYTVTSASASAPLQEADIEAVELCLAHRLAARKGIRLSEELMGLVDSEYTKLVKRTRIIPEADLSEMPAAQGPWNRAGYW